MYTLLSGPLNTHTEVDIIHSLVNFYRNLIVCAIVITQSYENPAIASVHDTSQHQ